MTVVNEEVVYSRLAEGKKVIAAIWHQRLFSALAYSLRYREFNPLVMISQSRDGDLVSPIAERLGLSRTTLQSRMKKLGITRPRD